MGDHFVLLVDRLLTESTLEAAIESRSWSQQPTISSQDNMISSHNIDVNIISSSSKLVECRICHDEGEDSNMESPCSCCGSLKVSCNVIYAISSSRLENIYIFYFHLYVCYFTFHLFFYFFPYNRAGHLTNLQTVATWVSPI